jgi:hypothetical protein
VGNHTQDWLDAGAGASSDSSTTTGSHANTDATLNPQLAAVISDLARYLTRPPRMRGDRGGGDSGGISGAGGAQGVRSVARASSIGGRAAAGAYAVRGGVAATLAELGLSLDELVGLSRHEQAKRLVDAATGPSGDITESELRLANAELILWALSEESEPTPIDLANRWVVEYVWQVWISEAGSVIRSHAANGYDSLRVEQEMRAALEATVSARGLPEGRSLVAADFERAISATLASLQRIGQTRR